MMGNSCDGSRHGDGVRGLQCMMIQMILYIKKNKRNMSYIYYGDDHNKEFYVNPHTNHIMMLALGQLTLILA